MQKNLSFDPYGGLGWEDICVKLNIKDHDRKAEIRRVVLNTTYAGGRIGATVRADGSGPNREQGR